MQHWQLLDACAQVPSWFQQRKAPPSSLHRTAAPIPVISKQSGSAHLLTHSCISAHLWLTANSHDCPVRLSASHPLHTVQTTADRHPYVAMTMLLLAYSAFVCCMAAAGAISALYQHTTPVSADPADGLKSIGQLPARILCSTQLFSLFKCCHVRCSSYRPWKKLVALSSAPQK